MKRYEWTDHDGHLHVTAEKPNSWETPLPVKEVEIDDAVGPATENQVPFTEATPENIDQMVDQILSRYKPEIDPGLAHRLLLLHCMDQKVYISDLMSINRAVERLVRKSCNLHEGGHLTVKHVLDVLKGLPEGMPVLIDCTEAAEHMPAVRWELSKLSPAHAEECADGRYGKVVTIDGVPYLEQTIKATHAFGIMATTDAEGKRLLLIHSNY